MKILLADDSITAQNMGKKILTEAGHEVVAVSNGAAAMKKIVAEKPDLLVLDVYMPGYSGLEVCEKMRAAAETSHTPVLLTVGKFENYQAQDGERVGADGVIVKPFEASDLIAAIQKLEQKMGAAAGEAVLPAPVAAPEFRDASYEEWKVTAADHTEEETGDVSTARSFNMSAEMASAPAFGVEEMEEAAPEVAAPEAVADEAPVPESAAEIPLAAAAAAESASGTAWDTAESVYSVPERDPNVEFTSPPREQDGIMVHELPELETNSNAAAEEVSSEPDPALVTDSTQMATAFPTHFGVEGAEPVTVGVAADTPGLYEDERAPVRMPPEPQAAAEPEPMLETEPAAAEAYVAEAPAMEEPAAPEPPAVFTAPEPAAAESAEPVLRNLPGEQLLDAAAYEASQPQAVQPYPAPAPEPEAAPTPEEPDLELASALAAAMGALPPEPAVEAPVAQATPAALDPDAVAEIVERVVARRKADLMAEIMREIEDAKQR